MTFELRVARHADRALAELDSAVTRRLKTATRELASDPYRPCPGADINMLQGERNYYRLRGGDYRVFYHVFPAEKVVVVDDVRHKSRAHD
ncbi:MAG: type II toxin-antitoxin system RelE family toxin [Thermoplasmatota archaeon]